MGRNSSHSTFISCVCSAAQSCPTLYDPMNCINQGPLSKEFSRQEYWSGLPFPRGIFLTQRTNLSLLHWQADLCHCTTWEAQLLSYHYLIALFHVILPKYFNSCPFTDISIVGQSCLLLLFQLTFCNLSC